MRTSSSEAIGDHVGVNMGIHAQQPCKDRT